MSNYKEFYPTPESLIEKMLDGVNLNRVKSVLEPSAGKGDIADALVKGVERCIERTKYDKEKGFEPYDYCYTESVDKSNIDTIEIDPDLQSVLKGKGYRVIYDNFLLFHTYKHYDLIIMNPPFSNGEKHLLKALDIQKRGGAIICVLAASILKNPYTKERKLLLDKLKLYEANIAFYKGEFLAAERKTEVEIAIIRVDIPPVEEESVLISRLKKAWKVRESEIEECNALIDSDYVKAIIQQYNFEIEAGLSIIRDFKGVKPYMLSSFGENAGAILDLKIGKKDATENDYISHIRHKYWNHLFYSNDFTKKFTSNLLKQCRADVDRLKDYDFNAFNIYQVKIDLVNSMIKAMEETILKLFDDFSHKHSWYDETSKNVHYYDGWKTNKCWIINKKVIIPLRLYSAIAGDSWSRHETCDKLSDIEKTLDYLSKKQTPPTDFYERIMQLKKLSEETGIPQTKNIEFKHFYITCYKKGTCHITFKDEELLKKFNLFGSQRKGWLPPSYGKVKYEDMGEEERAVVDEFEGEESYRETVANSAYLLGGIQLLE